MDSLLVAAIDFGTTYSGWAFSFKHDFEKDPTKVSAKNWNSGQLISQKGPTCLLIESDGKTLDTFGYEAESKYAELAIEGNHKEWYFYKRFKMLLFGQNLIERRILLEDATGKKLPAKTVFKLAIKYLKDDLISSSAKQIGEGGLTNDDISWVLTVPAIWNDAAKQFMREAAQYAGIPGHKLTICLEPEAASIYCRHLPVEKSKAREKQSLKTFSPNTKYMILDAGGGTIDISVHEIMSDGNLRELHKASGGAWGGTKVDEAFENLLGNIFGKPVVTKFKETHIEDYIELFRDFEFKKREISPSKEGKMTMRIPRSFFDLVEEVSKDKVAHFIQKTPYKETVTVVGDKIRIEGNVSKSCFSSTIQSIIGHVEMLLKEPSVDGCSAIVMVGGFSESPMLQEHIQDRFRGLKIIIPDDAGLAVLKGAVIFGHKPTLITERVCKYTYGIGMTHVSSSNCNHPPGKKQKDDNGCMRCYDIFNVHATVGQSVKIGEETEKLLANPVHDDQTAVTFGIYSSPVPNPFFVTEPQCKRIGGLEIPIHDTSLGRKRQFEISFIFGGTEIQVKVVDKTSGTTTMESVNFLE